MLSSKVLVGLLVALGPWTLSQYAGELPTFGPVVAGVGFSLNWWRMQASKSVIKDPGADQVLTEQAKVLVLFHGLGLWLCFVMLGTQTSLNLTQGIALYFTRAVGVVTAVLLAWQMSYLVLLKLGRIKKEVA